MFFAVVVLYVSKCFQKFKEIKHFKIFSNLTLIFCFSQIKVDCITVSTNPVKAVIDDHIQRLFDALLNALRKAINMDVHTIDSFLSTAMETLSQRPQTVEEIGEVNAKHSEFAKSKSEVSMNIDRI
jgi:hypothetical protein